MTDASNVAAGAVLMQWQKRQVHNNEDSPEKTPTPASDTFAAMYKARMAAGYKLQVLGYYSRPSMLHKDNGSYLTRKPAPLSWRVRIGIDSSLVNQLRPPRLQRWGIELGSYLPYLRVGYRMGLLNKVADLMSGNPIGVEEGKHSVASLPDDLFDTLAAVCAHGQKMAESACTGAQVALLSEHQVASTD
eukprot:6212395-Pleurochrysis_carterae.AAC.5